MWEPFFVGLLSQHASLSFPRIISELSGHVQVYQPVTHRYSQGLGRRYGHPLRFLDPRPLKSFVPPSNRDLGLKDVLSDHEPLQ